MAVQPVLAIQVPLPPHISEEVKAQDLIVCSVLSGNRNFEGRVNPQTKCNYLASPGLVVAYAFAGSMKVDLYKDPIGHSSSGKPIYLKDIWPKNEEIQSVLKQFLTPEMFQQKYQNVFEGSKVWQEFHTPETICYEWQKDSNYIKKPPFFEDDAKSETPDIKEARILAVLSDNVTTDHISPAGAIPVNSPAADYLRAMGVSNLQFNSFGSRRGNHEVMMRGTFGNIRLRNQMVEGLEGGFTKYKEDGEHYDQVMSIFDAAMKYKSNNTPLVVFAGQNYGMGSSRDWAAKGTCLLGIRAVIAKSFERIHRSNLIGMGVLPLQITEGQDSVIVTGEEKVNILNLNDLNCGQKINVQLEDQQKEKRTISTICRIDTPNEMQYYQSGGILHFVLKNF